MRYRILEGRSNDVLDLDCLRDNQEELFQLIDELGSDFGSGAEEDEFDLSEEPPTEKTDKINNSSDSEDDLPLSHFQKLQWIRKNIKSKDFPAKENFTSSSVKTPNEYFAEYLNYDFFQLAANYTYTYFLQKNCKENNFTPKKKRNFLE
ncbi:hypothetical protein JTB14_032218 [Gonioctena quinquepunctata]|nr:hypothetical protein JTB14_032218 [Gonioctena quinquepunctata]